LRGSPSLNAVAVAVAVALALALALAVASLLQLPWQLRLFFLLSSRRDLLLPFVVAVASSLSDPIGAGAPSIAHFAMCGNRTPSPMLFRDSPSRYAGKNKR
jgi:hypothetical protein